MLLNYHIGRIVLGSMCVGISVWLGWSGIRVAGFRIFGCTSSLVALCKSAKSLLNCSVTETSTTLGVLGSLLLMVFPLLLSRNSCCLFMLFGWR